MCHGSRKRIETRSQRTHVERRDTIKVKKSLFLNSSEMVNFFSDTCFWIDLTVMNIDAKTRYLQMSADVRPPSPAVP